MLVPRRCRAGTIDRTLVFIPDHCIGSNIARAARHTGCVVVLLVWPCAVLACCRVNAARSLDAPCARHMASASSVRAAPSPRLADEHFCTARKPFGKWGDIAAPSPPAPVLLAIQLPALLVCINKQRSLRTTSRGDEREQASSLAASWAATLPIPSACLGAVLGTQCIRIPTL